MFCGIFKVKKVSWELQICQRQITKSREASTAGPAKDRIGSGNPQWPNKTTVLTKDSEKGLSELSATEILYLSLYQNWIFVKKRE